jgi:hypothetical protein
MLRRIFGPKWDEVTGERRKVYNEELNLLKPGGQIYLSPFSTAKIILLAHAVYLRVLHYLIKTAVAFRYSFNRLVFITSADCVYCAVRNYC